MDDYRHAEWGYFRGLGLVLHLSQRGPGHVPQIDDQFLRTLAQ